MPSTLIVVIGTGMAGLTAAGAPPVASCSSAIAYSVLSSRLAGSHQPPIADALVSVREAAPRCAHSPTRRSASPPVSSRRRQSYMSSTSPAA